MQNDFKLPGSSYEEVIKLIKAYSTEREGEGTSLERISNKTGVDKTVVSRNNGFLASLGIISDGKKKTVTDMGRKLGTSYTLGALDEMKKVWKEILFACEFTKNMYEFVQIKGEVKKNDFAAHIQLATNKVATAKTQAGANALIEIFCKSNIMIDTDGVISINVSNEENQERLSKEEENDIAINQNNRVKRVESEYEDRGNKNIAIHVNICGNDIFEHRQELLDFFKELKEI